MLYNIVCGNLKKISDNFIFSKRDKRSYIEKADIRQRIYIGENVNMDDLPVVYKSANVTGYELPEKLGWHTNKKNMSATLIYNENISENRDCHVAYITLVTDNYHLLSYEIGTQTNTLATYFSNNEYVGCAALFPKNVESPYTVMNMTVYDKKASLVKNLSVIFKNGKIIVKKSGIQDKEEKETANKKAVNDASKNLRSLGFKIHPRRGEMMTSTYIVSEDALAFVEKATKRIRSTRIFVIPNDKVTDEEYIRSVIYDKITKEKIRSITTAGINIPITLIKEMKILYVFSFDMKKKSLYCIRS